HASEPADHSTSHHAHVHPDGNFIKALAVGLVHGAAGSGGLLVLVVAVSQSTTWALFYVLSFGLGSIAGMATLSFVASYPLKLLERGAGWLDKAVMAAIGGFAVLIGGGLVIENSAVLGF
ncbi:MAG TPA: urease accessory protein, partial [Afifellaceae bacterium]|nr:urease accessory protein [Afifellaceae bacterium]